MKDLGESDSKRMYIRFVWEFVVFLCLEAV